MKLLVALLCLPTVACVIEDDGGPYDPPIGSEVATISAHWSLRNMADGATTACPAGFDTVRLLTMPVDAGGEPLGDPNVDLFDCDRGTGIATDLPPDLYQVWIEVTSHDLSRTYAQSLSQILDVRDFDDGFDVDILNDGGFFQMSWNLVDKTTLRPLACGAVGAENIRAVSTSVADAHRVYDDVRPCDDHTTVTDGLLAGTYNVSIDAMIGDRPMGAKVTLTNQKIGPRNAVTDLGTILLPVDRTPPAN